MSYKVELPQITERIKWGNDTIGFVILDIETKIQYDTVKQREIRLSIHPLDFEISHHFKTCIKFGLRISKYAIRTEIQYGELSKV